MRSVDAFAFVKGTEVRNLLFYGLLPNLDAFLPIERLGHLALYVCSIRLLHHGHVLGEETNKVADQLFTQFYIDHELFYADLQNFKLHLHSHYSTMYRMHGALSNVSCFGPEDLIGSVSSNVHGTRSFGESIAYYYNIEFHLSDKKQQATTINGPHDLSPTMANDYDDVREVHASVCICDQVNLCCAIYRRFIIREAMFHSLSYPKKQSSISYFVTYAPGNDAQDRRFGIVEYFFTCVDVGYAVIRHHRVNRLYSESFKMSGYYFLLRKSLDFLYFVLEKNHCGLDIVRTDSIISHCIVFDKSDHLLVAPFTSYSEHD